MHNTALPICFFLFLLFVVCNSDFSSLYDEALALLNSNNHTECISVLHKCIDLDPNSYDALQLLGSLYISIYQPLVGSEYLHRALLINDRDPIMLANYIESLRASNQNQRALEVGQRSISMHPQSFHIAFNLGVVEEELGITKDALAHYTLALTLSPTSQAVCERKAGLLLRTGQFESAEQVLRVATEMQPGNPYLHYHLGVALHKQNKFSLALAAYNIAEQLNPDLMDVQSNIGAVYHSLGQSEAALQRYLKALPHREGDAGLLNNIGSLYGGMGKTKKEVMFLTRALEIEPGLFNALINLAGYHQDEGDYEQLRSFILRAIETGEAPYPHLLHLRLALYLSPVSPSWPQMLAERRVLFSSLKSFCPQTHLQAVSGESKDPVPEPNTSYSGSVTLEMDSSLDRIHFYLAYHGLLDRHIQELVQCAYRHLIPSSAFIAPHLRPPPPTSAATPHPPAMTPDPSSTSPHRVKIGFFSKFFGLFEPHGLLLDGLIATLYRSHFEVFLLAVARNDGKPLHHTIVTAITNPYGFANRNYSSDPLSYGKSNRIVEIPLFHATAIEEVLALGLDIIVYADTMSEPMGHFLAQTRLATLQLAFWGNPITSGSPSIDYFLSADMLEHPYRTRLQSDGEPYTEQVALLDGQGIWYTPPLPVHQDMALSHFKHASTLTASPLTLSELGLGNLDDGHTFLFFCPQSVFKIHPLFDQVLKDILAATLHLESGTDTPRRVRIVVTGGRRKSWTRIYTERLKNSIGPELGQRLIIIPRVSSEKFASLLALSHAVLHPFPFDGSKTAADCLHAGKPFVTLPSEYLRGRMGGALLRTMNIPELVAHNYTEYVTIASRLAGDPHFYSEVKRHVVDRIPLIWDDMSFPFEASRLICRAAYGMGLFPPAATGTSSNGCHHYTFPQFLEQTGGNVTLHAANALARAKNQAAFRAAWGAEEHLLHDGVAVMSTGMDAEGTAGITGIGEGGVPRIFSDWKTGRLS